MIDSDFKKDQEKILFYLKDNVLSLSPPNVGEPAELSRGLMAGSHDTDVKPTSIAAYHDFRDSGKMGKQEAIVYHYVKCNPLCSRRQIERGTGITISSITARVHSLILNGLIKINGIGIDPLTNKMVEQLEVKM